jgi:hypothetical protein
LRAGFIDLAQGSLMQSFLAKCAALGIVAGGFTLTGDVGRLADRGQRLLDAHTVPSETPAASATDGHDGSARAAEAPAAVSAQAPAAPPQPAVQPTTAVPPPATAPARSLPSVPLLDAPIGRTVAIPPLPAKGPDSIDLRHVPAGSRVLVWIRRPGSTGRSRSTDMVALDLIDPNTGEALEHRHAARSHGREGTTVHAAPRRGVITRDSTGRIAKGATLKVAPLHGVIGLGNEEALGTVLAVDVQSR